MASKSKKFCIATEGATTDGRHIERADLLAMAKNYDPKLYGARINMEHVKGLLPDGPFKRYGDVLELSTEEGKDGKLRLYAVIDPTEDLIALSKTRQKVYSSMEINPDFADTGAPYLQGLAITDDPASLGTEMLLFSATAKANPLASRKLEPENLFSEAVEFTLELEEHGVGAALLEGFSAKIKDLLTFAAKQTANNDAELKQAVELIAESQRTVLDQFTALTKQADQLATVQGQLEKLSTDHAALVQKLSNTGDDRERRKPATGSTGAIVTDC